MRKGLAVAFALVVAVFVIHCAHMKSQVMTYDQICPGGQGHDNPRGPVICLDARNLTVSRDGQHVLRGSWIHFYMNDPNQELDIRFKEPGKVQFQDRRGNQCWLRIRVDAALGHAPYTVINLTTKKEQDPEVMIDP